MTFQQAKPHVFGATSAPAVKTKPISDADKRYAASLFSQSQFAELESFARKLTLKHPQDGMGWKLLGAALQQLGQVKEALQPSQNAAKLLPFDAESFNNLAVVLQNLGKLELAEACFKQALTLKPVYPVALVLLADVLRIQGKLAESLTFYQEALKHSPDDGYLQHHIATLSASDTEQASAEYVAKTFDSYAETFDAHLLEQLEYAPEKLTGLLTEHVKPEAKTWEVLDLGCGTGLVGELLAPFTKRMVGVDLSSGMLAKAQERGIYDKLVCEDLLSMMRAEPSQSYDVITSGDVFVYVGKLEEVMAEAKRLLRPAGALAFSTEALHASRKGETSPMDYQLEATGRYSHSQEYLDRLSATHSFSPLEVQTTVLRKEAGTPVQGRLVVWRA